MHRIVQVLEIVRQIPVTDFTRIPFVLALRVELFISDLFQVLSGTAETELSRII